MKSAACIGLLLCLCLLGGFGCTKGPDVVSSETVSSTNEGFSSTNFGYMFSHPTYLEVNERPEERWAYTYLGKDMLFYGSLRDTARAEKPESLMYLYAWPKANVQDFVDALTSSDATISITSEEDMDVGTAKMKRIISTNASQTPKTHYVWEHNGYLLIFSVFLNEEEAVDPILRTIQSL